MSLLYSSPELNFSPTASDISPSLPPNPATIARPAVVDSASAWSCVTCRRRKVRCNKQSPCSNCIKSGIECVFPLSRQASRKSRRPADREVLSRLRRLEDVIEHLRGKNAEAGSASSLSSVQAAPLSTTSSAAATETSAATTCISAEPQKAVDRVCAFADSDPKKASSQKFENEFGRLVIDESRSRYVSNLLWASLGNEIEELKDILHDFVSEDDGTASPECSNSFSHDGFLFGFYSISHSLREYYPPSPKALILWKAYKENVAPLITIIHGPTARKLFIEAAQHPETLDKNSEALVFSMCLSAVVSMSPAQCLSLLGADRETAAKRYRFAVEQALARANFLNTQSLILLQAAVLFLICVRREDDSNFVWSLNAIVLRLAQGLGLHRDGTNFGLKPFETEMRRRLWWHICLIDTRSSEDHGTDPFIHESMYDTRLPLNVNDDDIYPEMDETPQEREGFTDVTFCLIRCEITVTLRQVNYACASGRFRFGGSVPCTEGCGGVLQIINKWVEERYIKHCDLNIPIHWASALAARLILSKLWLIMHHPMTRNDRVTSVPQATRESLFLTAIEVLEFGRLLETNEKTAQWAWLFRTNMQWHELAFVLSEICVRPSSPVTDRAWLITNSLYSDWEWQTKHKKGMLWRPLAALMSRAALTRAKQQELRAQFGPTITAPSEPTEHFMPGSTGGGDRPLPRIHLSMELLPPSSATQTSQTVPTVLHTPLNINLSKGPRDGSQDIFPDASFLPMQNAFSPSLQQNSVSVANLPIGPLYNNSMDPVTDEDALRSEQLSWDEWDQVMREFQIDVENSGAGSSMPSNITEWFA